nr:TMV resistance protein N [Tanacetum cinerariifolium]
MKGNVVKYNACKLGDMASSSFYTTTSVLVRNAALFLKDFDTIESPEDRASSPDNYLYQARSSSHRSSCTSIHEWDSSMKIENDMMLLGKKIKRDEENIKYLRFHKNILDDAISDMQVTLGKYHSSTTPKAAHFRDVLGVVDTLEKVDNDNLSRRPVRAGSEHQQMVDLNSLLESMSLSQSHDRWFCDLTGDGEFRVKEVHNFLDNLFLPSHFESTRWVKYIPIKINVFAWRAHQDYLPTRANLNRRGIILDSSTCLLCQSYEEDIVMFYLDASYPRSLFIGYVDGGSWIGRVLCPFRTGRVGFLLFVFRLMLRICWKGALGRRGFTKSDHNMFLVDQDMRLQLLQAIEESKIYFVVFSNNYASSVRPLDELVDITDYFGKFYQRKVLPLFYKGDPSDVRSQQGSFKEAFQAHEANNDIDPKRVQKWKQAIRDAGQLSGLPLQNRSLDELVDITDCLGKFHQRKLLPLFYKVDPSDVRSQQGSFMGAFQAHEANGDIDPKRVQK